MDRIRRLRRLLPTRRRVVVYLVGYLLFVLLMSFGGGADRLILYPSTQPIPLRGITRVEVRRPGAAVVEVWTARSAGVAAQGGEPAAYCLEFVGNASRGEQMAAYTADEWGGRPVEVWGV